MPPPPTGDLPPPNLKPTGLPPPGLNTAFNPPTQPQPINNRLHHLPPPSFDTPPQQRLNTSPPPMRMPSVTSPPPPMNNFNPVNPPPFTNIPPPMPPSDVPPNMGFPPPPPINNNLPPPMNNNFPPPINNNFPPPINNNLPPPINNNPPPLINNSNPPSFQNPPPSLSHSQSLFNPPSLSTPPIFYNNETLRRGTIATSSAPSLSLSQTGSLVRLGIVKEGFYIPTTPASEEIKLDPKNKKNVSKTLNGWLKQRPSEQELYEKHILQAKSGTSSSSTSGDKKDEKKKVKGDKKNRPLKLKASNTCMNFTCKVDLKKKKHGNCKGCGEIFCLEKCLTLKTTIYEFAYKKPVLCCEKCYFKYQK